MPLLCSSISLKGITGVDFFQNDWVKLSIRYYFPKFGTFQDVPLQASPCTGRGQQCWRQGCTLIRLRCQALSKWESWDHMLIRCICAHTWHYDFHFFLENCPLNGFKVSFNEVILRIRIAGSACRHPDGIISSTRKKVKVKKYITF